MATGVADRSAAAGGALRLVASAAAAGDHGSAHLLTAALTAVDGFSAVVEFSAAFAFGALRRRAIAAATGRGLAADFSRGTVAAVVHLAAAIDEAAALAPGFLAGLSQTAAIVDAALVAGATAALEAAAAAV